MRIVSLVPHATELLFALGLGDQVVGVTHECDHPAEARERRARDARRLPAGPVARRDRRRGARAHRARRVDLRARRGGAARARARPHRHAGAVPGLRGLLRRRRRRSPSGSSPRPQVISLDPKTYGETLADVRTIAQATDATRRRRSTSSRAPRGGSTRWSRRVADVRAPPARRRARVVRPGVRRRALDAAAHRDGRRRGRARLRRRALRAVDVGDGRRRRARRRRRDAVRLRRRARRSARPLRYADAAARRSARGAGRRRRRVGVLLAARARGSSTGSSCSRTSCTPTASRARRAAALDGRRSDAPRTVLYLHSSAGRYGADRQLALLATRPRPRRATAPLVVLAEDGPLRDDLRAAGVEVHVRPLAVAAPRADVAAPGWAASPRRGRPTPAASGAWRARAASRSCTRTRR